MGRWTLRWKERKISPVFEVQKVDLESFAEIGLGRVDGILKGWTTFIDEADNWAKSYLATYFFDRFWTQLLPTYRIFSFPQGPAECFLKSIPILKVKSNVKVVHERSGHWRYETEGSVAELPSFGGLLPDFACEDKKFVGEMSHHFDFFGFKLMNQTTHVVEKCFIELKSARFGIHDRPALSENQRRMIPTALGHGFKIYVVSLSFHPKCKVHFRVREAELI